LSWHRPDTAFDLIYRTGYFCLKLAEPVFRPEKTLAQRR